jgi:hypothetical protein
VALVRFILVVSSLCALNFVDPAPARAQDPSAEARVKTIFRALDLNGSGWLSGRELEACDCRAYDTDRNGEVTWDEFRVGYARAPLFGGNAKSTADAAERASPRPPAAGASVAPAASAPSVAANAGYQIGQTVEVNVDGVWHTASIVGIRDGRYALSRHDRSYGVTTSDEWVDAEKLRPYVAKARVPTPPAAALPTAIPTGDYACTTYGTHQSIGKLRIYGAGSSSGVTPDGSGPQHRFTYDSASGTLRWVDGMTIAGWTVEAAEYRPELSGTPNINLHYRLRAGGNLNSMSCTRR